jgi:hypothetical protein
MANTLEQLKKFTTVVADTGDIKCGFKGLTACMGGYNIWI